jgi:hypothetical protein
MLIAMATPAADGCRKGGTERLEMRHFARLIGIRVSPARNGDRMSERANVDEAHPHREEDCRYYEPCDDERQREVGFPPQQVEKERSTDHAVDAAHGSVQARLPCRLARGCQWRLTVHGHAGRVARLLERRGWRDGSR